LRHAFIVIILIVIGLVTINPALGGSFDEASCPDCGSPSPSPESNTGIEIWTDNSHYGRGDIIKVFGTLEDFKSGVEVGLVVIGPPPFNNIVTIIQIPVSSDGTFKTILDTSKESWRYDGTYTIKVTYGNQAVNNRVLINLGIVPPLSVETEHASYSPGSTIVISGFIKTLNENYDQPVLIRIVDPDNSIVTQQQVAVNSDRTYSISLVAGGTWKTAGEYTIFVNYGAQKAETTFEFTGGEGYTPPPPPPPDTTPPPPPDHESESIFVNGAFTENGITWCAAEKPLYDLRGDDAFFEHHKHSIESRICAKLYEDPFWNYNGSNKIEKLIDRSLYYSELEIAESQVEAGIGIVDTTPADVPERESMPKIPEWVRNIFIWYAEDRISEDELLDAIQFLLDQGILKSYS